MPEPAETFRFDVAFSFAGPHREKVRTIAELVAAKLGRERVFYDEWYEHEILGDETGALLQRFYHERSLMVVADLSDEYAGRPWCRAEASAIRALRFDLDPARDETGRLRLLNVKLGDGSVPGVFTTTAYLEGIAKTAEQCAELILKRHALLVQRMSAPALLASESQAPAPHAARGMDIGKAPANTTLPLEWLRRTGVYVAHFTAYFIGGAALGEVVKKIFLSGGGDTMPGPAIWFAAAALALSLFFLLAFNIIPPILHAREKRLKPVPDDRIDREYFTTKPREHDPHGFFAHGYDAFLEWAAVPVASILHLTGLSGSGKSSLLSAFLAPRLAEAKPRTHLVILRSYTDPLVAMKEALVQFWKKKPDDYDSLPPLEALRRAAARLPAGERLLVAFDQFEEFFILRATATEGTAGGAPLIVPIADLAPLREFFNDFRAEPPHNATLLLSYREDHRGLMEPLGLPTRREGEDWRSVEPLGFAEAADFLGKCPGLPIPEERMSSVLREAARQEGGHVVMRPIVANILGIVLARMAGHPTLWRRSGDLLRSYVRDCLAGPLEKERAAALRELLTDFHTARPRAVEEIAGKTGLAPSTLNDQFGHLELAGLVRCLNDEEGTPARRVWQIAHDFIATLTERVLDAMHRTLWHAVKPWLGPASFALWLLVGLGAWPWVEKHRAIAELANVGLSWNEKEHEVSVSDWGQEHLRSLDGTQRALRHLRPRTLTLIGCRALHDVHGLSGLTSLERLDFSFCDALQNVDGLAGLSSLLALNLSQCSKLESVDGLTGLNSLLALDLSNCSALKSVDFLNELTSLRLLKLIRCSALENVDVLKTLTSLQLLYLSRCSALKSVDIFKRMTLLQTLDLTDCDALQNVNGLENLISLQVLDLSECDTLQNVDDLKRLTSLKALNLKGCDALGNVNGIENLTSLQVLDLSNCGALQNIAGLEKLSSLRSLDLSSCRKLKNVDDLQGLTSLGLLKLEDCTVLRNVDMLRGLTSLRGLDLSGCNALLDVHGLQGLTSLRALDLHNCGALQDINGLKGLEKLEWLSLFGDQRIPLESSTMLGKSLPKCRIIIRSEDASNSPIHLMYIKEIAEPFFPPQQFLRDFAYAMRRSLGKSKSN